MDSRWFKEDREKNKGPTLEEEIEKSKKALKNSTLFRRRLERILQEELEATYKDDEDFSKPNWEREYVANTSRRRTLREVLRIIQM